MKIPIVGPLLFEPLCLHCCALLDTGPQVCHEAGRVCGGHDIAILDHCVDVDLPFAEELQVGGVFSIGENPFCRLSQSLLSPDRGAADWARRARLAEVPVFALVWLALGGPVGGACFAVYDPEEDDAAPSPGACGGVAAAELWRPSMRPEAVGPQDADPAVGPAEGGALAA